MARIACAAALLGLAGAQHARAQWATQTLPLTSQWSAVYLSIDPARPSCDDLFAAQPRILSIRMWNPRSPDDVYYDETAGSTVPQGGSWRAWFPPSSPNRPLLDMVDLEPNRAYLFELSAGPQISAVVTGRPVSVENRWIGGIYHFVGLPAATSAPPDFLTFFSPAAPAIPALFQEGGEFYRVRPDGTHERIFQPALTALRPGAAYWVKAALSTEYAGPLGVDVESPHGWLDFGDRLVPQYIEIRNATDAPRTVRLRHLASAAAPAGEAPVAGLVPLRYAVVTPEEGLVGRAYSNLPVTWTNTIPPGDTIRLAFLPDAAQLVSGIAGSAFQSVLAIADDVAGASTVDQRIGVCAMARPATATAAPGLWVGEASITKVSRVQMLGVLMAVPSYPIPTARPFSFRLIAHVDSNGTARVLQRALIATRKDGATGEILTDLLADESLVPAYRSAHADAKVFRVSSANFPFMSPVALAGGTFGVPLNTLYGAIDIGRQDPVNPFLHAYAPLHDNLEQRAESQVPYPEDVEVYSIRRDLELLFQAQDEASPDPTWGVSACGGIYRENIYGLGGRVNESNRVIKVEGTFRLERAVDVGALIQ
jgi:hypothetical protein